MKILTQAKAGGRAPGHRLKASDMPALNCYLFIPRPYLKVPFKFRFRDKDCWQQSHISLANGKMLCKRDAYKIIFLKKTIP